MTIRRMRIESWIPRATNTHSEYVILADFPRHQWLTNVPLHYLVRTLPVLVDYIYIFWIS